MPTPAFSDNDRVQILVGDYTGSNGTVVSLRVRRDRDKTTGTYDFDSVKHPDPTPPPTSAPPVAKLTFSPANPAPGQTVTVDASASTGSGPLGFRFDFDQWTYIPVQGAAPQASPKASLPLQNVGAHVVTVNVTDPQGRSSKTSVTVNVATASPGPVDPPPGPDPVPPPTPGPAIARQTIENEGTGYVNVNDYPLNGGPKTRAFAQKFVATQDATDITFLQMTKVVGSKLSGGGCTKYGSGCYGAGDGGRIHARLLAVNLDGSIDYTKVLGELDQAVSAIYPGGTINFVPLTFKGANVKLGQVYAVEVDNTHPSPEGNYVSPDFPVTTVEAAGPLARQIPTDAAGPGPAGLDRREGLGGIDMSSGKWEWATFGYGSGTEGAHVGSFGVAFDNAAPVGYQPGYAYWERGTVRQFKARKTTYSVLGAFNEKGAIGRCTAKVDRTGQTESVTLGGGYKEAPLSGTLTCQIGDTITLTPPTSLPRSSMDGFIRGRFPAAANTPSIWIY